MSKTQISNFKFRIMHTAVCLTLACLMVGAVSASALELPVHGFLDARGGFRTQDDATQKDESLAEVRLQLDWMRYVGPVTLQVRSDFLYDGVVDDHDIDLEEGDGWIDLREANLLFSPVSIMDVKAGRQILTWGTGDLIFINDLFPKDWQSFFIGRDEEYLKAPSDALFVSLFPSFVNIDVAYTPRFDADRFITGERLSYWNPALGSRAGREAEIEVERPDDAFSDDEIAVRISRNLGGYELAAYGYDGFWKSPAGSDFETGRATFPELRAGGASVRGRLGRGIVNVEGGYYDSREDEDGDDPLIRNSEARALVGYQQELAKDLTATIQYYLEYMIDHDAYETTLPEGMAPADEDRHVVTLRLTQQLLNQNLRVSFFGYYSPSDEDVYLRPNMSYKVTDNWLVTGGGNVFLGKDGHTFFSQFERNNNMYAGVRYSF